MSVTTQTTTLATIPSGTAISTAPGDGGLVQGVQIMDSSGVSSKWRACTFRTPGRAGTTGQNLLSIHNATGSTKIVTLNWIALDMVQTVVKAVTVLPPVIRIYRVTVLPTNGTVLTKVARDSSLTSDASITIRGDASADGTSSATTLTATIPAGAVLSEEYAPRMITAAGYEPFDRAEFISNTAVTLRALEGIVVRLDYVLATQNPITDMWIVSCEGDET